MTQRALASSLAPAHFTASHRRGVMAKTANKHETTKASKKGGFRSLLLTLKFLGRYPGRVAVCITLLLINIAIEMTLPQIIGNAITNLRWHMEWGAEFPRLKYVALFLTLYSSPVPCGQAVCFRLESPPTLPFALPTLSCSSHPVRLPLIFPTPRS